MTIRKLINLIGFEVDNKKLKESEKKFNDFKTASAGIIKTAGIIAGAITTAGVAVFELTNKVAENAAQILHTAKDIGIAGESLQEFRYSAKLAGIETEKLDQGMKFFARNVGNASRGMGSKDKNPFDLLGISIRDSSGHLKSQEDLLLEVSDKMKGISDQAVKASVSMQLFGRGGIRMAQWLSQGREEIVRTSQEAIDFGYVMSQEALEAGEAFHINMERITTIVKGLGLRLGAALMPAANQISESLIKLFSQTNFIPLIKQLAGNLANIMKAAFNLLIPLFKLLGPILNFASMLMDRLFEILNSAVIPLIASIIEMIVPLLADLFSALQPLLDVLLPIIGILMKIIAVALKLVMSTAIGQLRIFFALLKPILEILNYILSPLLYFINKIMDGLNSLVDMFTGKFSALIDLLVKGKFKEAFSFLIKSVKEGFFEILNFFIDGANMVIGALNLLPIKTKFELLKKLEIDSKNPNVNQNINTSNKNVNVGINNQFAINGGSGSPEDMKNAIGQASTNVLSLELKKILISAGY